MDVRCCVLGVEVAQSLCEFESLHVCVGVFWKDVAVSAVGFQLDVFFLCGAHRWFKFSVPMLSQWQT